MNIKDFLITNIKNVILSLLLLVLWLWGTITYCKLQRKNDSRIVKKQENINELLENCDPKNMKNEVLETLKTLLKEGSKELIELSNNSKKRFEWWYVEQLATLIALIGIWH